MTANQRSSDESGKQKSVWEGGEIVQAVAYDVPSRYTASEYATRLLT